MIMDLPDLPAMAALGGRIAGQLRAGDVVALSGPVGAGKTTLARGIIAATKRAPSGAAMAAGRA